jgi:hypothetical protein
LFFCDFSYILLGMAKLPAEHAATVTGAARLVGVTEGAIRAALRRGDLTPHKLADGRVVVDVRQARKLYPDGGQDGPGRPRK